MTKNKSPAFQWYPKDFMSDSNVVVMNLEEQGAYLNLLNHEWLEEGLPVDDESLAVLSRALDRWPEMRDKIMKCFNRKKGKKNEKFVHPRLEKERQKQAEFRKKRSRAGKISANSKRDKRIQDQHVLNTCSTQGQHKVNSTSTTTSTTASTTPSADQRFESTKQTKHQNKGKSFNPSADQVRLANWFFGIGTFKFLFGWAEIENARQLAHIAHNALETVSMDSLSKTVSKLHGIHLTHLKGIKFNNPAGVVVAGLRDGQVPGDKSLEFVNSELKKQREVDSGKEITL